MATNCITAPCPPSCAEKWRDVEAETAQAVQSADPLVRNRKISAAYASMNIRRPDMQWIGLASIVSRQAGCAMEYADDKAQSWNPLVSDPASVAKQALAETNKLIYQDMYPVMRFFEKHGAAELESCQSARPSGKAIDPQLMGAAKAIARGDVRTASDAIANYEQTDIVQTQIYSNKAYKETFHSNEYWSGKAVGRFFGARKAEIPLSSDCATGSEVPFAGSISNTADRIAYYEKLMNQFQKNGAAWRYETLSEIVRQGR